MGIKGLLPLLQSAQEDRPLSHFQGQKAGIDGYVWLHRAAYAHASELAIHKNDPPVLEMIWHKMAQHLLRYCNKLLAHDVTPYVVFDGGFLPLKEGEERTRDSSRAAAYEKGMELWKAGDGEGARKAFVGAYDVVPEMASACCRLFDGRGIEYVVAPYEADSQLSYLCEAGFIDFVITEDSDLLPFRTHSVLYKLDLSGSGGGGSAAGKHVCMDDSFSDRVTDSHLEKVFAGIDEEINKGTKMKRGNNNTVTAGAEAAEQRRKKMDTVLSRLLTTCILLGCDYGDTTIDKAGPKKVSELVAKAGIDPDRVQRCARFDGLEVKSNFLKNFLRAWFCFRYQTVYCPRLKRLVSRSMIEVGGEEGEAAGVSSSSSSGTEAESRKSAVVSKKSCDGLAIRLWAEEVDAEKHFSKLSQKQRSELLEQILNNPPDLFCGHRYEAETAQGVASGKLHPVTYEKISFGTGYGLGPGEMDKNAAKNAQPAAAAGGRKAALATTASRPALFARQHDGGFGGGGKKKLSKKEQLNQGKEAGQVDILSFFKPAQVANPEISRKMLVMEKNQAGTSTTSGTGAGTGKAGKTAAADATTRSSTGVDATKKRGVHKPLGAGDPGDEEGEDDGDNNVNAEQNSYVPSRFRGIQEALLADNVRTDVGVAKFAEEFGAPAEEDGADDHEEVPAAEVGAQEHGAAGVEETCCGSSRSKDAEGAVEAGVENKPDTEEAMGDAQAAEKEAVGGEQTMDVDSGAVAGDEPVQSGIGIARAAAARPPSAKAATKKAAALQQKTAVPTNTIAAAASTESFFARKMKNKKQDIAAAVGVEDDDATGEDKGDNAGDDFFADFAFAGSQDSAAHAKTNLKRLKPAFHVAVAAAGPGRGGAAGMERYSNKGVGAGAASKIMSSKMGKKNGQSAGGANTETATTNTAAPAVVVPVAGPARGSRKRLANAPSAAGSAMKEIGVQHVEEKDGPLDAGASSAAARKKQKVDTADEPLGAVGKRKEVVIPSGLSTSSLDFLNSLGWQRN
mmetsp:Transcript_20841/g.52577  ORF Transcript_20841/g.52577 Transcript_20841/m.52577 type:complete len:1016 (+) Transcript_20841:112-3159(+)